MSPKHTTQCIFSSVFIHISITLIKIENIFITPEGNSIPINQLLLCPTLSALGNHQPLFCFYGFNYLDISHKWNHAIYDLSCLAPIT